MDPFTAFNFTGNFGKYLLTRSEFYIILAGFFLGTALAALLIKSPPTPKGKEKAAIRKGWLVPLLFTGSLACALWGFFTLGVPALDWYHLWGMLITFALIFLMFRFPRILGIPLGAGVLLLLSFLVMGLQNWYPIALGSTVAQARPLPENQWEIRKSGGASLVPQELVPGEIWVLNTQGFLSLTGGQWWISWHYPSTNFYLEMVHGLATAAGLEKKIALSPPPAPVVYYPSQLLYSKPWEMEWIPGL